MKKIKYTVILLSFLTIFSCDDFLDYKENDKLIPKTVKDYAEFLFGEVIDDKQDFYKPMLVMSDDVSEIVKSFSSNNDSRLTSFSYYTWKANIEEDYKGTIVENIAWAKLYHKVLICNIIIKEVGELEVLEKDKKAKNVLLAEAFFLRADAYFRLLNLYGEPFVDSESAKTALGVPINDEVGVSDKLYTRSSVSVVYEKIEGDLNKAITLFKENERDYPTIFRPNWDVAKLLLSRVYLYQKKYDECLTVAEDLIKKSSKTIYNLITSEEKCLFVKANTGILFTYEKVDFSDMSSSGTTYYGTSSDLMKLFSEEDVRTEKFFYETVKTKPSKYTPGDSNTKGKTFRIEEAYLNKAECLVELGKSQEAIETLNEIRKFRIKGEYNLTADTKEKARQAVRDERRRELCFEFHRWFDLRRYGMPELKHVFTESNGNSKTYILEKGSTSYTLPIPYDVQRLNPNIKNIKRQEPKTE